MLRRPALSLLALLAVAAPSRASAQRRYEVEKLETPGAPDNRVDFVLLGDGYREEDQDKLSADGRVFLAALFGEPPLDSYSRYFNVKLVHVVSEEDGADGGVHGPGNRDTALGARFGCNGIAWMLCLDTGAAFAVAASHTPEADFVLVVVNDPTYGGAGGRLAVFSTDPRSVDIARHELGHMLGGLADEYSWANPSYPACWFDCPEPNVTTRRVRDEIEWLAWIEADTPLPTPALPEYEGVVGLFEGARYQREGIFRPQLDCMMRNLGTPFCAVCREALVRSIYGFVSPIDGVWPDGPVRLTRDEDVLLRISRPAPAPDTVEVTWRVDGAIAVVGRNSLTLVGADLERGVHTVEVSVADTTALVREDPEGLLAAGHSWQVEVVDSPPQGCPDGGGECDGGTDAAPQEAGTDAGAVPVEDAAVGPAEDAAAGSSADAGAPGDVPSGEPPAPAPEDPASACSCGLARPGGAGAGWLLLLPWLRRGVAIPPACPTRPASAPSRLDDGGQPATTSNDRAPPSGLRIVHISAAVRRPAVAAVVRGGSARDGGQARARARARRGVRRGRRGRGRSRTRGRARTHGRSRRRGRPPTPSPRRGERRRAVPSPRPRRPQG